ncbi:filamentous hemagglutinin N-terminal domain-containing protein [Escherichia coli]|uniref:contact-dependent inhibition effector tRNA nuclease n=3 Tax=Escherichia coli TaxID=562 RepID=UPI00107B34F1|nr:contact-dependent inhibition effector tRNA nuclease [Escherichia coli]EEC7642893.1 filamentous hemagglutinin N-terminal domain-containing protein [Escherichia coli]EER2024984.1 filamentous hemagglutinin N-terminal domain-containing protein [Escherichia coli]EER8624454.1 filamentous hemagglutinin N-terminal domain-containing protein [Escherichia coli]EET2369239.1 filamentous hemagglutinin N-terminal domain-containing protein [Escherichia coli]EET3746646.1 filamentous hemagglutinin N-terminal
MNQPPVHFTYRLLSYLVSAIIAGQPLLPAVGAVITPQNGVGMDKAANGVPVVNIATPNGAGISHNRFTDYNVGKEGLILNNATGKLNPTQLGGLIQNNPNLKAGGEAKGIINEVTGGNRSLLQGYTEVAGKAANVMVANPYGITCDGCGFINTPHATLTTGRPVMNADGSLQALEVTEGSITINGAGLDGTRSDAVSIIARATEVNAALHAKDLTVTAGANRVTADGRVSALKGEGDVPKVAVDTGALGGMYARRIHLTSTESGVGVNLGNLYAREGDIILNSAGKLVLKNSLAGGNTTVTGTDVSLSGDNKAGGNLSVTGTTGLTLNQSRLVTDKNLVLSSSGQIVQNGGELTAGQNAMLSAQHLNQTSGTVNAAENVTLTTTDDTTLKGRSIAGKTLTVSSGSLNNGGTLVAGRDATVKTGTFSNTGTVQGNGLKVTATDLTSTGSIKSGSTLDISARNATLSGDAGAKDSARVTVSGTLENRGRLVSDDVLTLSATQINNSGTLSGAKELVASADTLTTTEKSVTHSDGNLMLNSASSTLAGETSAGSTVSVKGNSLKTTATAQTQGNSVSVDVQNAQLDGTQAARDILTLNASEKLTHSGKSSAPSLSLSAPELTSSGVLVGSALNTQSQTLTNSGLLQGKASLTVNTQRLDNQQNGTLYSAADLTLDIPDIRNSGLITGENGLTLNTASLSNPGKIIADTLNVRATTLDGDGLLQGAGALALAGDTLSQGRNGRWLTAGDLSLRGKTLHTAGTTQGQNLTVQADNWANSGSVLATGNLTASATGQLTSTGDIMSQGDTTLNAATTDNRGSLLSAGTLSLDGNSLDNRGTVQGDHVTIRQNSVTNSGTFTGIAALTLAARMVSPQPALMNNGGSLLTSGDLTITAGSITSSGHWQGKRVLITADSLANSGAIQAADSLTARLTGELVSAAGSKVTSNGEMALSALNLSNSGQWIAKNLTLKANSLTSAGDITGVDALTLTVNQTLNNHASGKLLSAGVLTLKADSVTNDGQLQGNATTITAGQLTNGGHLQGETLTLTASGGVNNRSGGVLMSRNALNVSTATLSNQGTIQGGGGVSLNATDRLQNDGKILSGSNLTLTAQVLANTGSGLVQAATLLLDVVNTVNGGRVLATGSADVKGTTLNNTGTLQGADLLVNYHTFSNSGTLLGTSGLGVKGSSLLQNGTGRLYSAGNLLLDAQDFSGQGQVVATGDVTLKLIAALTNHGTLAAGKTLSVTSQNAITNGGVMQGDAMVLGAGEAFTNNGMLTAGKGNSVFSAQRLFLNAPGSLQAGGDVSLNSRSDITISGFTGTAGSLTMNVAGTLLNSALIYAGNNLKLFTDRLHNQHGDILAGNSLWVQKDSSGTANSEIINRSGNIETTRGDITMNTAHLLNSWDAISASHEVIPGSSHGVISPVPENNRWWGVVRHDGVEYLAVYWGEGATVPDEYRIRTGDTETVTVSASGHAARISGGADMHIRAGRLDNEASFILAGGSMTLSGDTLNNQGWQEGTTGKETVWRLASGSLPKAWFTEPWYKVYRQVSTDATEASGTSPAGQYRAVISAAGDVSASFATDTGNTTVMPRAGGAGNTITVPSLNSLTPPTVSQGVSGEALLNESGTGITGPVWNDALPDTLKDIPGALSLSGASVSSYPLPSGNNGYFVPSTDPDSPYLITVNPKLDGLGKVDSSLFAGLYDLLRMQPGQAPRETDPAYTDEKQFLGSSYILDRLGLKPEKDYRFLGDAAFDTRYVSNVILNQTGSRYINGTGSDLAQMKYLMDSAAAQQKALGLTFGVSLTAGQVAQLTRSILWWESVTINGQTVMVPKLYLSPEDITLHNGSVISGNNVQLAGGNITNSGGSINAQNDLLLDSTGSIDNLNAGLINAGGALNLKAIGDIGNISSVISGKTVSLESATGNISNLTRTEQWAMNNGYNHFSGTDTGPLAAVRATDSLFMGAAGDISITGAAVSAGDSVLLSAGNDLNMNAIQAGERRRYGGSGWYETHAVAPTVTAGNSLMLSAGRDVNSQAAGIMAENSMDIRAGRDVNMAAESTGTGDHDSTFSMKTVHDSVRQQGTDMTSGGDITVTAGRDITSVATAVTAKGDIRVNAGHDIVLGTATESDYHYSESGETRNRLLSHQTTRTITEDSVTREKGSLLSGNRVTVDAGDNLTVEGSDVVADRDVSLAAGNHVDVLAATSTDTSWRFKETKKSGLMGTGGIGFTTGSSKTTHDRREAGTTQSQSASTIGSTAGNVSITAGKQAHISGSDVIANRDISITGDSVVVDPGHDRRTVDEKFEQKKSGLTVALSGAVGSAINNAATMAREAKETSDSRLAALKGTQAVLSGVQAGVNHGLQQQSADPNNGIGVSISLNHQQSKSETKYQHDIVSGSTLSAGNNVSVTATGKNKDHNNSGDILITGSQIKSGNDTSLNAQNDILLAAAADTRQTTGKNSSKGGGVGVSFGGGTNGGGLSIFASINGSKGSEKGNGTTWTETTLDAGKNVSLTSGHDTTLSGAQVSGEKVTADVGNNLTISSLQDSDRYDSRQNSVAAGGSFTFGSMSGSGYASISQDKIKSNYDSVREQSGIYAGKDGFDVTVGNHTQLNGAVIASTATDDKNSLSTGTLGWSDIHNQADYKASHTGISSSGGSGMSASQMVASNAIAGAANALTGMSGSSGHAEGTTSSAISGGNIIIRNKESQKQDIAGLSRDPENANDSIAPIFDREKEQKRLQEAQVISQISGQMSNIVMTYGETEAMKAARKEHPGMSDAQLRETPEYREVMKGYGTGSTPQMVVQAITGVLGGLNAGNPGQVLAGGLNPAVAQLIKQSTGDNREANLMAHAVWGALAAQLGGNNAASGAAGAFSGELAARYIIDNYYGGRTDSLSEQERQQISMLATIASGIAGGLAGNSTASAGMGAMAGKNAVENNYLSADQIDNFAARAKGCEARGDCGQIVKEMEDLSLKQRNELIATCASSPTACKEKYGDIPANSLLVHEAIDRALGEDIPWAMKNDLSVLLMQQMDESGIVSSTDFAQRLEKQYGLDSQRAEILAGAAMAAVTGGLGKGGKPAAGTAGKNIVVVDSGKKGAWNKAMNKPEPNTIYKVDGDKTYHTDNLARPTQVEATLSANVKDRNGYQQCKAGRCGNLGDEGGHLIASIFNGPGEKLNLLPMDGNLNKGAWKSMENTWAKALSEGKDVKVNIQPSYTGNSVRPDKFYVEYSINGGRPVSETFKNVPGGK